MLLEWKNGLVESVLALSCEGEGRNRLAAEGRCAPWGENSSPPVI